MPDLHWHVGEGAERETIAKATANRRSRRSWIAVLIVIVLGVGVGTLYRSIPEPAPRPTPMPSPTPQPTPTRPAVPAKLYAAIDQEAQALADGDAETYLALLAPENDSRGQQQHSSFYAWGQPSDDRPLYTIIDSNLRTSTKAWADIRQFRNGRWFRETRFYVWEKDRWLRSQYPDIFFWSGQEESLDTLHIHVTYAVEDRELVSPVAQQLEKDYQSLCRDLGCASAVGEPRIEVTLRGNEGPMFASRGYFVPAGKQSTELRFPSPRVTGIFEPDRPTDPNTSGLYLLAHVIAKQVAQSDILSDYSLSNEIIFSAIQIWAMTRIDPQFDYYSAFVVDWERRPVLPLEQLWNPPQDERLQQAYQQAQLLIYFVEEEYRAQSMPKLLKALGTADSFADLIEKSLGVPFAEFDQKWQTWVKQNLSSQ